MTDIETRPAAMQGRCDEETPLSGRFVGELDEVPPPPDTSRSPRTHTPSTPTTTTGSTPRPAEPMQTEDLSAYVPERIVTIDGEAVNADRDITISAGGLGYSIADITLFNLDMSTWGGIDQRAPVAVELGWVEGGTRKVFDGHVRIKRRRQRHNDRAYVIRAEATGSGAVMQSFSRTYRDTSPHFIVEDVAESIDGLGVGYISTASERITGNYTLSGGKDLADWLDRLSTIAADQTGEKWVWYVEGGKIYFHRVKDRVTDLVTLDMAKSLLRSTPTGNPGSGGKQPHQIDARCEPLLRRGLTVNIENATSPETEQLYMVSRYLFESSTVTGRHHCSAQIDPMYLTTEDLT